MMQKALFSRSALSKLQAIILLVVIIAAVLSAVGFFYEERLLPSQPISSPSPSVFATPTVTTVPSPSPLPASFKVSNLNITPLEAWPNQTVTATVLVTNSANQNISYSFPFAVDGKVVQYVPVQLAGGASANVTGSFTSGGIGSYQLNAGGQAETFTVVQSGMHTLQVTASADGLPFTLDGVSHTAPYSMLVAIGSHTLTTVENPVINVPGWGNVEYQFSSWGDGSTSLSDTVNVQAITYEFISFVRLSSCPTLYTWNGTGYNYVGDVNDGTGWLGFLEYFNPDGSMVFSYNYPYDYIKLNPMQLQPTNGLFNVKIQENNNEIFYLDQAELVAVDHPADVNVYSTKSTFVYNLTGQGTYYTVGDNLKTPVSAVNGAGQNVLPEISKLDGVYAPATRWTWNNITLNLGNLAGAQQIKLVVAGTTYWPTTSAGGSNFMKYEDDPGVMPSPPPYMQVMAANGSWVNVPNNREFPIPSTNDQEFVVNLTGLFPTDNWMLRINYYQDIQFDYFAVDTSPQQAINVNTLLPSSAVLGQAFTPNSTSSGAFTRYGDVTALLQSPDDKYVIGREGDEVTIQFNASALPPVPKGWVRDYFLVANCWFKGQGLPYVPFTVNPLPFQAMTSFPYPSNETYPYDADHQTYLQTYDTRVIT